MSIGIKKTDFNYSMLQPSGQQVILECSAVERDLGILVDDKLSFSDHIHTVAQKANKIMAVIKRTFVYLNSNTLKLLFKAIVRPHLEYGVPVWYPYKKKEKECIEDVQRRATDK